MANKFNKFYAQSLKLKAASADPYLKKKAILVERINKINEEYEMKKQQALKKLEEELKLVQAGIDAIDNIVKAETDGYGIEDLCYKEGKKWVLKYPETIVPDHTEEVGANTFVPTEEVNEETGEVQQNNPLEMGEFSL